MLDCSITQEEQSIVKSFIKAQKRYKLLTKRKYAYFWTIYGKYLPIPELEFNETIKVYRHTIESNLQKKKGSFALWKTQSHALESLEKKR